MSGPDFLIHDNEDSVGVVVVETVKAGDSLTGLNMVTQSNVEMTAKSAIPQAGLNVQLQEVTQIETTPGTGRRRQFPRPGIQQVLPQLLAEQILRGQVINTLGIRRVAGIGRSAPALDQIVANPVAYRHVHIMLACRRNGLSMGVVEVVDNQLRKGLDRSAQTTTE